MILLVFNLSKPSTPEADQMSSELVTIKEELRRLELQQRKIQLLQEIEEEKQAIKERLAKAQPHATSTFEKPSSPRVDQLSTELVTSEEDDFRSSQIQLEPSLQEQELITKKERLRLEHQQRKIQLLQEIDEEKQAIKEELEKAQQVQAEELVELNRALESVKIQREAERLLHIAAMDELAQAQKEEGSSSN